MDRIIENFFNQFFKKEIFIATYQDGVTPKSMMNSSVDVDGYYNWKPIKGTLKEAVYEKLQTDFKVKFPKSFISWHQRYYFFGQDCSIIKLPASLPHRPLQELSFILNHEISTQLAKLKLCPFAYDKHPNRLFVFDTRTTVADQEYPIRIYEGNGSDLHGLSEVIFSSFSKLLECLTYLLEEVNNRKVHEIIPGFFCIDPKGAGASGISYWTEVVQLEKAIDDG
jgi:hypothetical protein